MAISAELVRERTHVTRTLHVVLAPQRIDAHAFATEVARGHRKICNPDDRRSPLAVLRYTEPVIDRTVARCRIQPRGTAHELRSHTRNSLDRLGRVALLRHKLLPSHIRTGLAPCRDVLFLCQTFRHDDMGQRIHHCDIRARCQLHVHVRLYVGRTDETRDSGIDDDQLRALAQPALQLRAEYRMRIRRIGPDDHDNVGLHHRGEGLGAGRLAESILQTVARRRVAYPRAGIDVVGSESRADEFLDEERLLVRAAR